jgi:hypothetical protein
MQKYHVVDVQCEGVVEHKVVAQRSLSVKRLEVIVLRSGRHSTPADERDAVVSVMRRVASQSHPPQLRDWARLNCRSLEVILVSTELV